MLCGPEEPDAAQQHQSSTPAEPQDATWGFATEAYEGDEWEGKDLVLGAIDRSSIDPDAYYLKEPKKALVLWVENRGEDPIVPMFTDPEDEEGLVTCRIELPIETGSGKLVAIGQGATRKKVLAASRIGLKLGGA